MPRSRRSAIVPAPPERVWEVLADPHHMPRWWPELARMEGVEESRFTQVFHTKKGRPVRVDFDVVRSDPPRARAWEQELAGTPFERFLHESRIEAVLEPADGGTRVTLEHRQRLRGTSKTGGFLLRRATNRKLDAALEGLREILS